MTRSPANPRPVPVGPLPLQQAAVAGPGPRARRGRAARRWRPGGASGRAPTVDAPRRILVVQLDHLGDAVLTSPLLARLRAAYPEATIDVLASPSNHEVFEADPHVDRVRLAERNWFERQPGRWGLARRSGTWAGRSAGEGYDLGIDVRGDVLTVLVLALAGIPRRVGWAMGGGGFLLTDVADWVPAGTRSARGWPCSSRWGSRPTSRPAVDGPRRPTATGSRSRRWLAEAWPRKRAGGRGRCRAAAVRPPAATGRRPGDRRPPARSVASARRRARLAPRRAGSAPRPPLLAVHLGAGTAAKRWPRRHWNSLIERFLERRLAGRRRRRARGPAGGRASSSPTTGSATGPGG